MANLKENVTSIIAWLHAAIDTLIVLIRGNENEKAVELIQDVRDVITSYLGVFQNILPVSATTPMPGNLLKKIAWVAQNTIWIQTIAVLFSGLNPFDAAKARAAEVAAKWGFADKIKTISLGGGF